jgi:hypothetical protein
VIKRKFLSGGITAVLHRFVCVLFQLGEFVRVIGGTLKHQNNKDIQRCSQLQVQDK